MLNHNQRKIYFRKQPSPNNGGYISGSACPLRIHDSYAMMFWICCSGVDGSDAVEISTFGEVNCDDCLLPDEIDSSLGQTLLLTARLTETQKQQKQQDKDFLKKLADQWLHAFITNKGRIPKYRYQGQLFGSPIFEYGQLIFDSDSLSHGLRYCHVLIWFFDEDATKDKFEREFHDDFLYLFLYRNKIISSFKASREDYNSLREKYKEIENELQNEKNDILSKITAEGILINQDLKALKVKLKNLSRIALKYSRLLRNLEHHRNIIADNVNNYDEIVRVIAIKINLGSQEALAKELNFLNTFSQENCLYFQEQIKSDLGYFVHGSSLLDKAIASIRGIVEIDQAERDRLREETEKNQQKIEERRNRNLETTIAVVGVGLALTEIVAGSTSYLISQDTPKPIQPPFTSSTLHPFFQSLLLSLFCGVAAARITWWLITLWQRYSDKKEKLQGSDHTPN